MSTGVRLFARPGIGSGFALAGFRVVEPRDTDELIQLLEQAGHETDIGVTLVQDELLDELPAASRAAVERRAFPILVPFPGPRWADRPTAGESYVLEILQRAIGYRVRLR
jgi:vacuolar-type H+-ATPase subunit F/Vma7